ncbi:mitotic spindle checkpoint protein Bub1/Mad3 [Chloropicon primus]|nr:mitotic spindle checkpoint protein Bub1/Mad3 [Chloropicon primus]|eukprot:QDZ22057.1 mitotic spindle checkpoint protein Bub1/Mad3 [Chloropicon primus]
MEREARKEEEQEGFQWETSKENLQPVKVGRSAEALKQATGLVSGDRRAAQKATQEFEDKKRSFEAELTSYEGDDKLGLWVLYLKWYQTALPAASKQTALVQLLERCTNDLFEDEKCKRDARMLRIWIQYADLVKDPEDIFRFLQVHNIGQEFALFYEAYALCLEKRGSHKEAMAVYDLGIANMAMPLDRLRKKLTGFHKRMAKRAERDARRSLQATPMTQGSQGRHALSSIQRSAPFSQDRRQNAGVFQTPVQATPAAAQQQARSNNNNNNEEFSIYADTPSEMNTNKNSVVRNALSTIAQEGAAEQSQPDWNRLQTQDEISKENEQAASKWNTYSIAQSNAGPGMQQQPGAGAPAAPSLDILVDEEFVEPTPFALGTDPASTVRQRADGHVGDSARKGVVSSAMKGSSRKSKVKPSETVMAYDELNVKDAETGEDLSFEERRALLLHDMRALTIGEEDVQSELEVGTSQGEDVTLYTKEAFETIDAMFTSQKSKKITTPAASSSVQAAPFSHQKKLDFGLQSVGKDAGAGFDLEIYEDTTFLPSTSEAQEPGNAKFCAEEVEDKENGLFSGAAGGLGNCAPREGLPLDEMSDDELRSRGIEVGSGLALDDFDDDDIFTRDESLLELPADRLKAFTSDETDDFQVFCDEE